ncbi:MAG: DOMON-like domain-containing protein [Myxococcota bacterium]
MPSPADPLRRTLVCHPAAPCAAPIDVNVELTVRGRELDLAYRMGGDVAQLQVPTSPLPTDRLWAYTCCELFAAGERGEGYLEWNFSPTGQSAHFGFSGYRQRTAELDSTEIPITTSRDADALLLRCSATLPAHLGDALQLGISTVLQDRNGAQSYWALHHPATKPDFHDRGGFVLALDLDTVPARSS